MTIYQLLLLLLKNKIRKNYGCDHSFGKVELETGLQYCAKCGESKFVKIDCNHSLKIKEIYEIKNLNRVVSYIYVMECTKCGDLIERRFNSN